MENQFDFNSTDFHRNINFMHEVYFKNVFCCQRVLVCQRSFDNITWVEGKDFDFFQPYLVPAVNKQYFQTFFEIISCVCVIRKNKE